MIELPELPAMAPLPALPLFLLILRLTLCAMTPGMAIVVERGAALSLFCLPDRALELEFEDDEEVGFAGG